MPQERLEGDYGLELKLKVWFELDSVRCSDQRTCKSRSFSMGKTLERIREEAVRLDCMMNVSHVSLSRERVSHYAIKFTNEERARP